MTNVLFLLAIFVFAIATTRIDAAHERISRAGKAVPRWLRRLEQIRRDLAREEPIS